MAKGKQARQNVWDACVAELQKRTSAYRMHRRNSSRVIQIRRYAAGKVVERFSSGSYCWCDENGHELPQQIEACRDQCLKAHEQGQWALSLYEATAGKRLDWPALADGVLENLRARVARQGSRKNAEGHLKQIRLLPGPVATEALEAWAKQRDPITQAGAFRNRLETLAHINESKLLDLSELIAKLKKLKPTGAAKKEQSIAAEDIKAIPADDDLQAWLDGIKNPVLQWTFAMVATYGLRPSEAWHVVKIDAKGWAEIPGPPLCKTARHIAPPVPRAWVDRYQLRDNLAAMQKALNKRWPIRWEKSKASSLLVPVNNSQVSHYLWSELYHNRTERLLADAVGGNGQDWVRPYDLRHSYAIRCFTHPEVNLLPNEDFARWMGHGLDVHERVYLRFMSEAREDAALQQRHDQRLHEAKAKQPKQQPKQQPKESELPAYVMERLQKLEQLEALLKT